MHRPPLDPGSAAAPVPAHEQLRRLAETGVVWPWRVPRAAGPAMRAAAVLVLFGALDDVPAQHRSRSVPAHLDVLLLGRATTMAHHPGQVSFPGGGLDPHDDGPVDAALREAVEETGLDRDGVEVLGVLDPLPLPVSNNLVTPVLAWWQRPSPVRAVDHRESATVFRAPVADLLAPEHRRTVVGTHRGGSYATPAFLVPGDEGHVVWGFTALVLDHLFDALGWTEPWDRSRTIPAPR